MSGEEPVDVDAVAKNPARAGAVRPNHADVLQPVEHLLGLGFVQVEMVAEELRGGIAGVEDEMSGITKDALASGTCVLLYPPNPHRHSATLQRRRQW